MNFLEAAEFLNCKYYYFKFKNIGCIKIQLVLKIQMFSPVMIETYTVRKRGFVSFMWLSVGSTTTTVTPDLLAKVWDEFNYVWTYGLV